ncbi:MAG TPA: amino acid adenylation domain-containing protein [Vicinamibacterales bacterium]|nr:amino acid adenylation domain-containing protein [Vicinamibacterales bacterium]
MLRTTYRLQSGIRVPWQVISDVEELSWQRLDWSGRSPAQVDTSLDELLRDERTRAVSLETAPTLRLTLATVAATEHYLIVSLPSLCADARSLTNLFEEVVRAYSGAEAAGDEPLQYADFADWHWQLLEEDEQSPARTYWREQRLSASLLSTLYRARNGEQPAPFDVAMTASPIDHLTVLSATALAGDQQVPASDFYLACWQALVWRLAGQPEVVTGAIADDRGHDTLRDGCGLMSMTLPVRSQFGEHTRFDQVLEAVARSRRAASDRQFDFSWERDVEGAGRDGEPAFFPLSFEFHALPPARVVGPVTFSVARSFACTDRFAVKVNCVQRGDAVGIEWHFDPNVLSSRQIEHLARHYQALVRSAIDNPRALVLDLDLFDETLRQEIVVGFNGVRSDEPIDRSVHECFEEVASQSPDRTALVYEDQLLSYGELNSRSNRLGRYLRSLGVGSDVPVALCVERSLDMIVGMLGVFKAGGAYVPLDPSLPAERLALLLAESRAPVVVCQPHLADLLSGCAAKLVVLDAGTQRAISQEKAENCLSGVSPANLAYAIFTSGSTGTPKGVLVEHRQLVNYVHGVRERLRQPGDVSFATVSSYAADLGNTAIFPALLGGGCLHVVPQDRVLDPGAMADYGERHAIDCLKIVPSHLSALLSAPRPARLLPRRCLVVGGEASTWDLVSRLESLSDDCQIVNHYGPTEATVGVLAYRHERGHIRRDESDTLPLGRPLSNSRVYLLDSRARPVPVGVNGELHIAGAGLARGYLDRPDQTAERFIPDPIAAEPGARMYRTGDLARHLADGNVEFVGRVDHQVKIRGFRVELGEIESALERHEAIDDVVVTVSESPSGDKRLVGYAVRRRGAQVTTDELRDWVRAQLPDYMVPGAIVWLDALPLNRNGKVDRKALPAVEHVTERGPGSPVPPRTRTEETLLGIWCAVLGKTGLGIHDDFFECGGHSLLAMQLITRVREAFRVDLPLPALFDTPTVAGIAESIETLIGAGTSGVASALKPVSRDRTLPLSFAQQRLWFLEQLEPNSSAYNRPFAFRLTGPLNLESLGQSLEEIVRRHEVLRTTYPTVDGEARQVIAPYAGLRVRLIDLRGVPLQERDLVAHRLAAEDALRLFDLARGPLVRACVMQLNDLDHVLLLSQHHINTDAWSNDVLVHEVSKAFGAFSNGTPSPLAELPIQYADYAAWQREWLESEPARQQLVFWTEEFKAVPPALELPTDRPRPAAQTFHGAARRFRLSRRLAASLRELSGKEGTTLFMTLLAAFQTLLHRYTGQPDILVGSPIAGRTRAEVEGLIGFFVNTLVLRADMRGNPRFSDVLTQVRHRAVAAYENQDLPFERLVDALDLERDLSRTPLFQVMFVLQTDALKSLHLADLVITQADAPIEAAKFDLTLYMSETEQGLNGSLEYNTDLFNASTIDRMWSHFETLLEGIVADPRRPVLELPLLGDAERRQLLVEWNDTRADYPQGECLHEVIEEQVRRSPDAVAVVFEDRQLTYGELNRKANQLARHLRSLGVGPEARVGLCLDRSLEMVVGVLGVLKAGAAYVPMDPAYPKGRLAFILQDSRATVLLADERSAAVLPDHTARVVSLNPGLQICARENGENLGPNGDSRNLSHVIYTSGSTGQPKGVAIEQRSVTTLLRWSQDNYSSEELAGVLASTSICFDLSVWELFVPLSVGGAVVLAPTALELPGLLAAQRVTLVNTVPSAIAELLRTGGIPSSVRTVNLAGEPLTSELSDALYSTRTIEKVCDLYGPSEDTTYSTFARRSLGGRATIGRPLAETRVYLGEAGRAPVPIGIAGELHLGGAGLARGYLDRPDLTAERFLPDALGAEPGRRIYRTGDMARWRDDGSLDFLGRIDHQVKIRGFRIELGEIESALRGHSAVRDGIVLAREDQAGVKRLVAYLTAEGPPPTVTELREHLRDRLPGYMIPAAFVVLDALPLLPNGKIDRRALPAPEQTRPELEEAFVPARTPIEQRLAGIWCRVLGLERVGVHDNFFELGGDSILSIQIVSRANQDGLRLSAKQVFEHQTIAELAAVAGTAPAVQAEQGRVTGGAPVTAIQQWFFDQQFAEPHHFNQAVLLDINEALDPDILRTAVDALLEQHDALRLRFVERDGGWRQEDTAASSTTVSRIDLSHLNDVEQRTALEAETARIQASLTLHAGPQIRVALFDLGARGRRLLLVIHHLVVDGVSWRILLEDLQTAYDRASRGESARLPPKTTSYAVWAQRCREYAASDAARDELPYWLSTPRSTIGRLPIDEPQGTNSVGSARSVTVALTASETEALLRQVPDVYRTQINDVLLTAVADAFAAWTGERRLLIDLEGHGREELFADVDVSRTVGWFTAMYPVALEWEPGNDPGASLKSIKEQLRKVPNRGIGYGLLRYLGGDAEGQLARLPRAEMTFNYLGQVDQALPTSSRFVWAAESPGPAQSPRATRSHLLDVSGVISDGCLRLSLKFSEHLHRRETIEQLAGRVVESLRSLIRHCQSAEAGGCTPSDFPMAELDQQALDRLVGAAREIEDVYPLSPMQQGLLFHTLLDSASGVYVEQFCCTVHGKLDLSRFQSAWQHVLERQPVLRTSFRHEGLRQPLQIVHRRVPIEWVQQDWRELSTEEHRTELDAFLQEDRQRGFDLSNPPLMRLAVLQIAADSYQIVWTYHHLLLDGWSVPIVLNEVLAAYGSFGGGGRVQPVVSRPYRDLIAWHRRQDLEAASQFWRRTLKGFEAPTPLTVDSPHAQQAGEVSPHAEQGVELSKASTDALRSFGRQQQLTLNTLVQAAWGVLLSRYSGRDDVLFGATVSGRPASLPGVESMVGLFINTVPVRVRVRRSEPLVKWLQTVQSEQLEARDYEYCPLSRVQGWSELPAGTPLFESLLVFENFPVDETLLKRQQELTIDGSRTIERTNYPLTLVAAPGQRFSLRINYDASRFDQVTVARMLGHLEALLEGMISDADRRIDDIPMLTGAERQDLLVAWNATEATYEGPRTVHEMFEAQVGKVPDAVALVYKDQAVTYAGLDRWTNQLAQRLVALGVKPNALVGLFMERGPEMVAGILGVLKAGGAYVPLPRDYPRQRLQFMLEDSAAALILTQEHLRDELAGGSAAVECVDRHWRDEAAPAVRRCRTDVTADDLAYVMYTSGSTGRPKGTLIEHRSVANYLTWCTRTYPLAEGCGAPVQSSIGFDATITSLIAPLLTGRRVVLLPESQEVEALGAALASDSDFGLVKLTPAHLKMLGPMVPPDRAPGGTRAFVIGGEALTANDVAFWRTHAPRTKLVNEYGPTETVVGCCVYEVSAATPTSGAVPIGRPIANTQLYVLDRGMAPMPMSVPGEIYIGGAGLGRGYLNRPELTAEKFVPNPFSDEPGTRLYRTGDLGRHRLDGELEYHGRTDDQVKLRGFRIELGEIEAVLSQHPQVREAVVLAREDGSRGKRLVAYVTSAEPSGVSVLELRSHLQGALPSHMVPAAFVMLDALPLTANGKVDRRALPAPDQTRQELQVPFVAAATDAEQKIAAIWKETIGIDTIGVDDNFFEAGGDSLIMIEVQWKLKDVFGRNVPMAQMFQHPTVRSLAAALSRRSPEEDEAASGASRSRAQARLAAVAERGRRRDTRRGRS